MNDIALAVYGGAFNPPHPGHQSVVKRLLDQADRVIVVPSYAHPFGKKMTDFDVRVGWVEAMAKDFGTDRVMVSTIEREIAAIKSPVYSIDLLNHLEVSMGIPAKKIALAIGEDVSKVFSTFYGYERIMDRFSILISSEDIALHSTMIREALKQTGTIPEQWMLDGLQVSDYIPLLGDVKVA